MGLVDNEGIVEMVITTTYCNVAAGQSSSDCSRVRVGHSPNIFVWTTKEPRSQCPHRQQFLDLLGPGTPELIVSVRFYAASGSRLDSCEPPLAPKARIQRRRPASPAIGNDVSSKARSRFLAKFSDSYNGANGDLPAENPCDTPQVSENIYNVQEYFKVGSTLSRPKSNLVPPWD